MGYGTVSKWAVISIHAPLTGSDYAEPVEIARPIISIHAPLTGSDRSAAPRQTDLLNFNPRSPYGERLIPMDTVRLMCNFNPRSPYGERRYNNDRQLRRRRFQSTLPLRGATCFKRTLLPTFTISIHAPLTGSDNRNFDLVAHGKYFNPRSPYGERLPPYSYITYGLLFQSTLPLRGATHLGRELLCSDAISIHAPLTGSDILLPYRHSVDHDFNPRSPYGERPRDLHSRGGIAIFQSTLPLRGATCVC